MATRRICGPRPHPYVLMTVPNLPSRNPKPAPRSYRTNATKVSPHPLAAGPFPATHRSLQRPVDLFCPQVTGPDLSFQGRLTLAGVVNSQH